MARRSASVTAAPPARIKSARRHIVMVAFPDVQVLDVTGPLEVFGRAARLLVERNPRTDLAYSVEIVAADAGPVETSSGMRLVAERQDDWLKDLRGALESVEKVREEGPKD